MNFRSVNGKSLGVNFQDALFAGIAPDGGLYVPEEIPHLHANHFLPGHEQSLCAIATSILSLYIDIIPRDDLQHIIGSSMSFDTPLRQLDGNIFLLELFHGPTLAFKDIGARFMAEAMSYFLKKEKRKITIVVATSGDTGSAVAHGFYGMENIDVYILYPSKRISRLQEQQIATLGGNVHAVEVEGTFDDCQQLVKQALADRELTAQRHITTANSINVGRLLPQITYYVWGYFQWLEHFGSGIHRPTFVVPTGNIGNLTAGMYAARMGTPIAGFIAATNENAILPEFLQTGVFTPRTSVPTLSNAMDVGNPSNLARLQDLYHNDVGLLRGDLSAQSISDEETLAEIRRTYERTGYILDPHTAVGTAAARKLSNDSPLIVLATAHPAKFPDTIARALGSSVSSPTHPALSGAMEKQKLSTSIPADYYRWKSILTGMRS